MTSGVNPRFEELIKAHLGDLAWQALTFAYTVDRLSGELAAAQRELARLRPEPAPETKE